MPIYEYECQACGQSCELVQKFSDPPATECPHCQANELVKLVSAASFHLKGGGWYVTDFKDKPKKEDKSPKTADNTTIDPKPQAKDSKKDAPKD